MHIELMAQPASAAAKITLAAGESITAETGAMIAMSKGLNVQTTSRQRGGKGGMMKGLKRMFSGESFFLNHFTADSDNQELLIGPSLIGDVVQHELQGTMVVQGSSWLASANDIQVDTTWQGFGNALFSGEGLFWVKCSGRARCCSTVLARCTQLMSMVTTSLILGISSPLRTALNLKLAKRIKVGLAPSLAVKV